MSFLSRPALWLPAVTIVFAVYASSDMRPLNALPSSVGSLILNGMVFVIGGLCVSAGWDAARLHAVAKNLARTSQMFKLLAWIFLPCWVWVIVAYIVLWVSQISVIGAVVYPHPLTLLLALVMGIVWLVLGVVFVWVFPHVVGLLMATVLPFTVASVAWSLPDSRWRHMFGVPIACCQISSSLNTRMVLASVLCLFGLAIIGLSAVAFTKKDKALPVFQPSKAISSMLATIGIVGFVSAAIIGHEIDNYAAAQPRDINESVCSDQFCFWPESSEAELEANKRAYEQIAQTMPTQWLSNSQVVVAPNQNYKIGATNLPPWILGDAGSALPFLNSSDPNEVYGHFAGTLVAREWDYVALSISPEQWQQWAVTQRGPATPEDVIAWAKAQLNY